jgi:integrase
MATLTATHRKTGENRATWSINKDRHDPPKSPYWFASFRDQHGRRVRLSTKTTDKTEAEKIAMEWAGLAHAGREGRLTESRCREVIARMYQNLVGEPLHFRTCRGYLLERLENIKADVDESTWRCYNTSINGFLAHLGVKADKQLQDITPTDIRQWRDKLKDTGLAAPTVNGHIKVLRIPFKAAHDLGYIPVNVCGPKAVTPVSDDAEDIEKDVFTPEQIGELIEAAPTEDWKGLILCGYFTGLRLSDCSELRWSSVDLSKQIITVKTRKTGKKVTIPIHPRFMSWLRKQTRGIEKAPVFPTLAGKDTGGKLGLSTAFKGIMDNAGIKGRLLREANGSGRSRSSLSFHSLRHSFNSALANAGVSQEIRQKLTGHASAEMNTIYTHYELAPLRAAVQKLPAIGVR